MCGRSKRWREAKTIIARWRVEAEDWQRFVIPKLPLRYT